MPAPPNSCWVWAPLLGQNCNDGISPQMNFGVGHDLTIRKLADTVKEVVAYTEEIIFCVTNPDGTSRKPKDVGRLNAKGGKATTTLQSGLAVAYQDFIAVKMYV